MQHGSTLVTFVDPRCVCSGGMGILFVVGGGWHCFEWRLCVGMDADGLLLVVGHGMEWNGRGGHGVVYMVWQDPVWQDMVLYGVAGRGYSRFG